MVYFVTAMGRMKKRLLSRQTPGVEAFKWRAAYDALGFEPPFDDLATKEQYEAEKEYNRGLSSFRVRAEHRIGDTERFKIPSERHRNPRKKHYTKTLIVAGMVNMGRGFRAW